MGMDTEFLSNLAHQLRSPLSSLRVWVDLLKDPSAIKNPADLRKLVDGIDRSTNRLERQITDVLEAGYLQAGTLTISPRPVDLLDAVTEAIAHSEQAARARKVSIGLHAEDTGLMAMADRSRLLQIVESLVSNSIKFSTVGSSVTINISAERPETAPMEGSQASVGAGGVSTMVARPEIDGDAVYVTIRDSGPGVEPSLHREIFKPFYRTKRAGAPGGGGAGLGLVIALGLVKLHGGELWLRSDSGEGAEFGFSLPAAPGE